MKTLTVTTLSVTGYTYFSDASSCWYAQPANRKVSCCSSEEGIKESHRKIHDLQTPRLIWPISTTPLGIITHNAFKNLHREQNRQFYNISQIKDDAQEIPLAERISVLFSYFRVFLSHKNVTTCDNAITLSSTKPYTITLRETT